MKIKTPIIASIVIAIGLTASLAQTPPPDQGQPWNSNLVTNGSPANIAGFLTTSLSLRNPNVQPFTQKNDFEVQEGLTYNEANLSQWTAFGYHRKIDDQLAVGGYVGMNTLAGDGSNVSGVSADVSLRYHSDNLSIGPLVGYRRDVTRDKRGLEVGINSEFFLTKNAGTFLRYTVQVYGDGRDEIDSQLTSGVTILF